MALAPGGRLFAHDDERAVIYQIDADSGAVIKSFMLGDPVLTGDFEGLAVAPDGTFWLTTSRGQIYSFREGDDGEHVRHQRYEAGLVDVCEIEGLAYLAEPSSLIFACKRSYRSENNMSSPAPLRSWTIGDSATSPWATSHDDFARAADVRRFQPSGVEIDPESGRILVLSANDPALVELDRNGNVLAARRLRGHRQPEGIAILADGSLVIADEASGSRPHLSRYARAP